MVILQAAQSARDTKLWAPGSSSRDDYATSSVKYVCVLARLMFRALVHKQGRIHAAPVLWFLIPKS